MRRFLGIGVGAALILVAAAALTRPPSAGVALTTTFPADGATVAAAPAAVELAFTEPVREYHVAVHDAAGTLVSRGRATLDEPHLVRQPVAVTVPGEVTVTYHVSFGGGEELAGNVRFGVGVGPAAAAPDTHAHDVDPFSAVLLVLDGAVAVGVVLLLLFRRPRRR